MRSVFTSLAVLVLAASSFALPSTETANITELETRASATNEVSVKSKTNFCLIVPKNKHTNVGDSEHPGGMTTWCTSAAKTSSKQGTIPSDFFKSGKGKNGKKYAQLTGCINPSKIDRLNSKDAGGQYDSSGGAGGKGNPQGSVCVGYKHYVELIEPAGPRACIRCCDDAADCPTNKDTQGCPSVIPGNYYNCG
ncbi:hypothetical protein PENSPDRAFT_46974 [Peniophora sp. CONT]|nr:hypothetical protein PENSPDRAFT_46974 [Peniophora sp. CONT]